MRQTNFPFASSPLFHGGAINQGKRKLLRPLSARGPIHLVLKSKRQLYANRRKIISVIQKQSATFNIRIYSSAVAHDHVHLVIKIPGREAYRAFIRAVTALLARAFGKGLWAILPFTRVASWGRDFRGLLRYLELNRKEVASEMPHRPRLDYYKKWR